MHNIALMLYVDWVKPFKRSQFSMGAVICSILNLPRSERLLKKWICVVGIIPGPTEPKGNMNTFLRPFVNDLLLLWKGIKVNVKETGQCIVMRGLLLWISCDIPAIQKVSQFLSHKAIKGCNKCKFEAERENQRFGCGKMSYYSKNFSFNMWQKEEVLTQSAEYRNAKTKTAATGTAKKNGVRYSEIH
eukprot:gene8548-9460_t